MRVVPRSAHQFLFVAAFLLFAASVFGQQPAPAATPAPVRVTLDEALARARRNSVAYQSALTDAGVAHEDKKQAVAALLPSVSYNNSAIYTEVRSVDGLPKFIAANAVHEYASQANVHE